MPRDFTNNDTISGWLAARNGWTTTPHGAAAACSRSVFICPTPTKQAKMVAAQNFKAQPYVVCVGCALDEWRSANEEPCPASSSGYRGTWLTTIAPRPQPMASLRHI